MSIADKLTQIAQNEQRVFDAGKRAVLKASKYMNGTARGSVVAVNDVSPLEHDVVVRLSSDTLTDFSGVIVKRCGKNVFHFDEDNVDILYPPTTSGASTTPRWGMSMVLPAGTYTLSAVGPEKASYIYGGIADLSTGLKLKDWNAVYGNTQANTTMTFANAVLFYQYCSVGNANTTTKEAAIASVNAYSIQLERGGSATPNEPYAVTEYTPNADGLLTLPNLSPYMTLTTDTDGVTIDCSYLRDIDTYIDNLTMSVAMTAAIDGAKEQELM